jgi:hypothetical protein
VGVCVHGSAARAHSPSLSNPSPDAEETARARAVVLRALQTPLLASRVRSVSPLRQPPGRRSTTAATLADNDVSPQVRGWTRVDPGGGLTREVETPLPFKQPT